MIDRPVIHSAFLNGSLRQVRRDVMLADDANAALAARDARIAELEHELSYFPPTIRALTEKIAELRTELAVIAGQPQQGEKICTHPEGCTHCAWCGFKAERPAAIPDATELAEAAARMVYESWSEEPGYVAWAEGGNSFKQDKARAIAKRVLRIGVAEQTAAADEREAVTLDGETTIRAYVADAVPEDTPMDEWTKGYEECKRRIHRMLLQPCNQRAVLAPAAASEPVAWQLLNTAHFRRKIPAYENAFHWEPLYRHPQAHAIPDGYALVPIEPTPKMIAALGFGGDEVAAIGHGSIFAELENSYRAMLAAAPQPTEGSTDE